MEQGGVQVRRGEAMSGHVQSKSIHAVLIMTRD